MSLSPTKEYLLASLSVGNVVCAGFAVLGCVVCYWYYHSFGPYGPTHGLKFPLPPKSIYPFTHRWMSLRTFKPVIDPEMTSDPCIHYIDERPPNYSECANAPVFLLFHGNPSWSFLYRKMICKLRPHYRCVAMDYPGFGLSTAPADYSFTMKEHSEVVFRFVQELDLKNIVCVCQDWGGPIGFTFACDYFLKCNRKIIGFVIGNTFFWPKKEWFPTFFSEFFGGFIGRSLSYGFCFFNQIVFIKGFYKKLSEDALYWYQIPFCAKHSRHALWVSPRQITAASDFLLALEVRVSQIYANDTPLLITWGTKDFAFGEEDLAMFQSVFKDNEVHRLEESSHFWQEDQGDEAADLILEWIARKN